MMSANLASPRLLKIKLFWNKGCNVIISVHDVATKILSHDLNYIVNVVMWRKLGNSGISMREVHNFDLMRIWLEKPIFLKGLLGSSSII